MNNQFFPEVNERLNRQLHERLLEEAGKERLLRAAAKRIAMVRKEKRIRMRLLKNEKKEKKVDEISPRSGAAQPKSLLDAT